MIMTDTDGTRDPSTNAEMRRLPSIHALLACPELVSARLTRGHESVRRAVRLALEEARHKLASGDRARIDSESLAERSLALLEVDQPRLRPLINATGVLLHTGLGRAPLALEAIEAIARVARGYCNLEIDLETGERGGRTSGVASLLCRLSGAEAALVVNNNAAATVIALRGLAIGREVVVSRGQLIEIGGSFRLPEIFEVSGARLREVGTTNKTRLADYEQAVCSETAALLRVHTSNFRIVGFSESVSLADLKTLAETRGLWMIDDLGSGALQPGTPPYTSSEPNLSDSLKAGADLVLFSGDKLLGGPQCGIILGSKAAVDCLRSDPLMRAFRVDKLTLAALEATLRLALEPGQAARSIPLWAFLDTSHVSLRDRAERLCDRFRDELGLNASVSDDTAFLGGGSAPLAAVPTAVVRLAPPYPGLIGSEADFARALRLGDPTVVPRVQGGAVLFDLRAVRVDQDEALLGAVRQVVEKSKVNEQE
jgi:L-seryl-tRNA(Ser) seleniumtransferase